MTLRSRLLFGILLLALISVAACNRSDEEPTTTPTKTSTPAGETSQAPTDTPAPPTATATSEPPTSTPEPEETATPAPTEEQSDTQSPQAEQVGEGGFLPATMESPDFGTQAFLWWRPEVAERDLNLIREGGFHWVKQTFAWENIEGAGKGHLDWSFSDRVVHQVNSANLKLLARISIDPQKRDFWAGLPPESADHFADYVLPWPAATVVSPGPLAVFRVIKSGMNRI